MIRRWTGTRADMSQPVLNHHYIVLHLGGPKQVERHGLDGHRVYDVAEGSLTIVPAGTAFEWRTAGPIDFAHLYIRPSRLNRAIAAVFDRDPASIAVKDAVGVRDQLLSDLIQAMLREAERASNWRALYLDSLFEAAVVQLARHHSTAAESEIPSRYALAPARLRRVQDYVESGIGEKLTLAELASVAGLSTFHFCRAFQAATGQTPLAYVARRRVEVARKLLRQTELPLSAVARKAGFSSPSYFATAFKSHTGVSPSRFRRRL